MAQSMQYASLEALPRQHKLAWLICLSSGLFFFYEFFQLNIFDAINSALLDDFKLNATQISWMSSMFLWANIIFLIPAGLILDKFSVRRTIILMMLICILGTLGLALTSSFAWACFFHFLTGIGNAFCFLASIVLVTYWFDAHKRALIIGLIVTMAFIGGMMAHTPFVYLTKIYGWRSALHFDVGLGLVLLAIIAIFVKDKPKQFQLKNSTALIPGIVAVLKNSQNWLAGIYTSCLNLPILVLCALWGVSYLQTVYKLTNFRASTVVSFLFIGSIIACPLVGWASDVLGKRKPIMYLGAIATLLSFVPLFLNLPLSLMQLNLIFFALGFFSSTQVISYPLIAESNFIQHTGTATGIASIIIMGGGGVGQILFGWLMQSQHQGSSLSYSVNDFLYANKIFPLAAILALIAVIFLRETNCKSRLG